MPCSLSVGRTGDKVWDPGIPVSCPVYWVASSVWQLGPSRAQSPDPIVCVYFLASKAVNKEKVKEPYRLQQEGHTKPALPKGRKQVVSLQKKVLFSTATLCVKSLKSKNRRSFPSSFSPQN